MSFRSLLGVVAIALLLEHSQTTVAMKNLVSETHHESKQSKTSEVVNTIPVDVVKSDYHDSRDGKGKPYAEKYYIHDLVGCLTDFLFDCRLMASALCGALLFFPFLPVPLSVNGVRTCNSLFPSTHGHNVPQPQLEFSVLKNEPTLHAASFDSFSNLDEFDLKKKSPPEEEVSAI